MTAKPLIWVGSSRADVRAFPADARRIAGFQLWRVQRGPDRNDWEPKPTVGAGVREIRVHTELEHRVLYIAKFTEGVYVLHAFEKRSRKTPQRELGIAGHRLRVLLREREGGGR